MLAGSSSGTLYPVQGITWMCIETVCCPPPPPLPQVSGSLRSAAIQTCPSSQTGRWACLTWACPWSQRDKSSPNPEPTACGTPPHLWTPAHLLSVDPTAAFSPSLYSASENFHKRSRFILAAVWSLRLDAVVGAACVPVCSQQNWVCFDFWCKITANSCSFDCCHGYEAHLESPSAVAESWCELLPAIFSKCSHSVRDFKLWTFEFRQLGVWNISFCPF